MSRRSDRRFVLGVATGVVGSLLTLLAVTLDVNNSYGPVGVTLLIGTTTVPSLLAPGVLGRLPARLSSRSLLLGCQVGLGVFLLLVSALYDLAAWMPFVLVAGTASARAVAEPSLQSLVGQKWESSERRTIFARLQVALATIGALSPLLGAGLREIWGTPWVLVVDGITYLVAAAIFSTVFESEPALTTAGDEVVENETEAQLSTFTAFT